eukprot:jgi/Tetstr1/466446/TSEL_010974.t1
MEHDLKNLNDEGARKNKSWTNVTKREWTTFWGLMLASTQYQERGLSLWSSTSPGITSAPNFGRFMSYARFRGIRLLVPWAKADLPSVHKDGWAWFRQMVADFNTNREAVLGMLRDATLDESMSAWQPRTSKKGGLPNLSFIARKPEPLATLYGDSWFTSIRAAVAAGKAGRHYGGVLKTAHGGHPKDYITSILDPMCAGDRLTLTASMDGVDLVAVGYKHNKKVIHFLATKGAAPTLDGDDPYKQRWLDEHGNLSYRDISCPKLCSNYFAAAPKVDNHHQSRQFDLKLEKRWGTHDC